MATQMPPFHRTQGDGMEKVENIENKTTEHTVLLEPQGTKDSASSAITKKHSYNKIKDKNSSITVKLTPQTVSQKNKTILENLKNKEPKFVPYEPYKAAVKPMVPFLKKNIGLSKSKLHLKDYSETTKRQNIGVGNEKKNDEYLVKLNCNDKNSEHYWETKFKVLESEMQILREENEQLEGQLKFQVQVNGELKNLLVAAVGEDIETKVHVLTEDKLHLAQALLASSKSLTSHQEQSEWLAGQCEVWRSKFLASSVMVEELARWKASLCQKINEANETLKKFLEERKKIKDNIIETHENLSKLRDNFDLHNKKNKPINWNVIEVSEENLKLSKILIVELLGSKKLNFNQIFSLNEWDKTAAEKSAERILSNPGLLQLITESDAACSAVVGAAVSLSGKLYLQNNPPKIESCPQCTGEIKLV